MSVWWNFYLACKTLTSDLIFTTLLADSADDKLVIAYFFFPRKQDQKFQLLHEDSTLYVWEKSMLSANSCPA